jgi:hypothetical protein
VIDLWEEGDGAQEVMLYKQPVLKVLRVLIGDQHLAGPSLYICRTEDMLGRVPLMPWYISCNSHPTLPHRFGNRAGATADSVGKGNGSRLYDELNLWMWPSGAMGGGSLARSVWKKLSRGVGSD